MNGQRVTTETKRTWCYAHHPKTFEISCPICGEVDKLNWSEWEEHLWCYVCEDDFLIESSMLNGPIPVGVAAMLGVNFDRIDLATGDIIKFNTESLKYDTTN